MGAVNGLPPLVAPVRGERYADRRALGALIAPPYDVVSPEEREEYARRDPRNIIHVILPVGGSERYACAAAQLAEWRAAGVIAPDATPAVYVVCEEFTGPDGGRRRRTGVVAGVAAEPFGTGRVRPHERTHAAPKADRLALLRATRAMCEALLMVGPDHEGELADRLAEAVARRPAAAAEFQGVRIALWRVAGRRAQALAAAAGREALYLADGHHRYETAVAYRTENPAADRVLALIVPMRDPGLVVLATHRLVHGQPIALDAVVHGLRERFHVRELAPSSNYVEELAPLRGRGAAAVAVAPGGRAVLLLLKSGAGVGNLVLSVEPEVAVLDVTRIDALVVEPLAAAAGAGARLSYSPDPGFVIDAVRTGRAVAGVLLNPIAVEQVVAVADAGAVMPQKSTYFAPKVPSGLVLLRY